MLYKEQNKIRKQAYGARNTKGGRKLLKDNRVAKHVPYWAQISPEIIISKSGQIMMTMRLTGFKFETADDHSLLYRKEVLNNLWRNRADSEYAIYFHHVHHQRYLYPGGTFPAGFAHQLNEDWKAHYHSQPSWVNELYLTIIRKPGDGFALTVEDLFKRLLRGIDKRQRRHQRAKMKKEIERFAAEVQNTLSDYSPTILTTYKDDIGWRSEPLEFLNFLLNDEEMPFYLPSRPIFEVLPQKRITFEEDGIVQEEGRRATFQRIVNIMDYPAETMPGLCDPLLKLPYKFIATHVFSPMDYARAYDALDLQRRRLEKIDERNVQHGDIDQMLQELSRGHICIGRHNGTVAVMCDSPEEAGDAAADVAATLRSGGILAEVDDLAQEASYWARLPMNMHYIGQNVPISSANFACMASLHNEPSGQLTPGHWGDAVTVLRGANGSPYMLPMFYGDQGSTVITGIKGTGKTLLCAFLNAQAQKYGGQTIFLDKDGSHEIYIRYSGGQYYPFETGKPTGINPFQWPDTPSNRQMLFNLIRKMVMAAGKTEISPEENNKISSAVASNFTLPRELRMLRHLAAFFGTDGKSELFEALKLWHGKGANAWVFDNDGGELDFTNRITGFDIGAFLDDETVRVPLIYALMSRIESHTSAGERLQLIIEEAAFALDDDLLIEMLKRWELTDRKYNIHKTCLIQDPDLALKTEVGRLIYKQASRKFFFAHDNADIIDYTQKLRLNERHYELIVTLPKQSRLFLFLCGDDAALCQLDLDVPEMRRYIPILSSRPATVKLARRIIAEYGNDPTVWGPIFDKEVKHYDIGEHFITSNDSRTGTRTTATVAAAAAAD